MVGGRPLTPTEVRDLARRHGIRPSKALGQNFVIDPNTIDRLVRIADLSPEDRVLEVGPGFGTLTLGLAGAASQVLAVEFDRALLPVLEEVTSGLGNVSVLEGDAMEFDFRGLTGHWVMVANLPYGISTALIARALGEGPAVARLVVMVQAEVGARLVAKPGSQGYGSISVLVAYHCVGSVAARVPRSVFWPPPKVDSVVVTLERRPAPVSVAPDRLMHVVRAGFAQRRKKIRNSLASALPAPLDEVEAALVRAGIDPSARAESLHLEDFARIAEEVPLNA